MTARRIYIVLVVSLSAVAAVCAGTLIVEGVRVVTAPDFFDYRAAESVQYTAAVRLLEGKPVYTSFPEAGLYNVYGFLHTLVYAAAMGIFGEAVVVPKATVFVCSMLGLIGLGVAAFLITGRRVAGLVAVGVFGALYPVTNPPELFGLRPDAFCASVAVWGLCAALLHLRGQTQRDWWAAIAAVLFVCAGLAKQTFVLLPVLYFGYLLWHVGVRRTLLSTAPAIVLGAGSMLWFNTGDEHLIEVTLAFTHHKFYDAAEFMKRLRAFIVPQIIPLVIGLVGVFAGRKSAPVPLVAGAWAAAYAIGFVPSIKVGGASNAMMFFEMVTALLVASVAVPSLYSFSRGRRWQVAVACAALVFLVVQARPAAARSLRTPDTVPLDSLRAFLAANADKRIYFPDRNYFTNVVLGTYYLEEFILFDNCEPRMGNRPLPADLVQKIESGHFDYVVGPLRREGTVFAKFFFQHYGKSDELHVDGWEIYVPLQPAAGS